MLRNILAIRVPSMSGGTQIRRAPSRFDTGLGTPGRGRRGGLGSNLVEEGFNVGVGDHFGKSRIGARLAYILITFIGGAAQINKAVRGIAVLREILGQHEIEKAAVGNRAVAQNASA